MTTKRKKAKPVTGDAVTADDGKQTRRGSGASPRGARKRGPKLGAVDRAEDLFGSGITYTAARDALMAELGCSSRTAERHLARVLLKWETEEVEERPAKRARMRDELWRLYADARGACVEREITMLGKGGEPISFTKYPEAGDYLDACRILERLCKLDGLDAPDKVEVNAKVQGAVMVVPPRQTTGEWAAAAQTTTLPKGTK